MAERSGSMFMAQGAGSAFQSRAAAVFGDLPTANLPTDIPDDLTGAGSANGCAGASKDDAATRKIGGGGRETFVAPALRPGGGGKRSWKEDDFEKPSDQMALPPSRKKRNRSYGPADHVLHPEKYTKYSLDDDPAGPFASMSEEEKNKAGAAQFFAEMRRRQDKELAGDDDEEDGMADTGKVVFRRAADRKTKSSAPTSSGNSSSTVTDVSSSSSSAKKDAVVSFDQDDVADESLGNVQGTGQTLVASDEAMVNDAPTPVVFSSRKKFRGRRRAADSDDDSEES